MAPFLCIITPVFDPALDCVRLLIEALKKQTLQDFIHVCISNGLSSKIKELVISQNDKKFIYDEIPQEPVNDSVQLICNLGKRREYCIKKYEADRFVFLDADLKILHNDYFFLLQKLHDKVKSEIIITSIRAHGNSLTFPIFPLILGNIDIANYTFSNKLAKKYSYPTDYDELYGFANDYRFFSSMCIETMSNLDITFAEKDGNSDGQYKRVSQYQKGEKL